jgi:uncharacterized membrane protein YgcG
MSPLLAGALALAADPTPNPTEGQLRPGLEEWQVSPGLIGFVVTFALALACVLLFLNMSKHLRQAGHNARQQGLPVPAPQVVSFRRADVGGATAGGSKGSDTDTDSTGAPDAGGSSSDAGSSGGDSGGSGD